MQSAGMNCSVIKVAGAGLSVKHLGQNVASPGMMAVLEKLVCSLSLTERQAEGSSINASGCIRAAKEESMRLSQ